MLCGELKVRLVVVKSRSSTIDSCQALWLISIKEYWSFQANWSEIPGSWFVISGIRNKQDECLEKVQIQHKEYAYVGWELRRTAQPLFYMPPRLPVGGNPSALDHRELFQ